MFPIKGTIKQNTRCPITYHKYETIRWSIHEERMEWTFDNGPTLEMTNNVMCDMAKALCDHGPMVWTHVLEQSIYISHICRLLTTQCVTQAPVKWTNKHLDSVPEGWLWTNHSETSEAFTLEVLMRDSHIDTGDNDTGDIDTGDADKLSYCLHCFQRPLRHLLW